MGKAADVRERKPYGEGRLSAQRAAIARAVAELEGAFSVEELAAAARRELPLLATATVYRAVGAMADAGFIERVGDSRGATLWARCDASAHHHHAVCERCGRLVCLECPLPEAAFDSAATGFRVTSHEYRIYGVCAGCARSGEAR